MRRDKKERRRRKKKNDAKKKNANWPKLNEDGSWKKPKRPQKTPKRLPLPPSFSITTALASEAMASVGLMLLTVLLTV